MSERPSNCFDERRIIIRNLIFIQLYRGKKILKAIFEGIRNVLNRRLLLRGNEEERNLLTHS
jgi:hypothetical protein